MSLEPHHVLGVESPRLLFQCLRCQILRLCTLPQHHRHSHHHRHHNHHHKSLKSSRKTVLQRRSKRKAKVDLAVHHQVGPANWQHWTILPGDIHRTTQYRGELCRQQLCSSLGRALMTIVTMTVVCILQLIGSQRVM